MIAKTRIITAVAIMATLMFCALSASTASAVEPVANAPVWSQGDSWAMGKSVDLDSEFSAQLDEFQTMLESMSGSANLEQFSVQASASAWLMVEVTSATDEEYVVEGKFAARFNAEVNIQLTGEMPAAGTETWGQMDYPKEMMTFSIDGAIDMAFVSEMTVVFEKSTMAIKSIDTTNKASAIVSLEIQNLPRNEPDLSGTTHSYEDVVFSLDFDIQLHVGATFSPALNLIEFPLIYGDSWNVSSLATITGDLSGHLDISGLPSSYEEMLFENEMMQNAGITGFPIDFSKLSTDGEPKIVNGTLVPMSQYINATMECTSVEMVTLPIYGEVAIFEITVNGGSETFYYADGVDFLTGVGSAMEGIDLPEELGGITMPEASLAMEPVTDQSAEQNIEAISSYQADLSGQAGGSNDDGIGGLILGNLPIIGLIAAIVVVVAIVAVVLVKRKK